MYSDGEWSHRENIPGLLGPSQWGKISPVCDAQRQSPINILPFTARLPSRIFPFIRVRGGDKIPTAIEYTNDGHGFNARYTFSDGVQPNVTGGPLGSDIYTLYNAHLHWPSEHAISGRIAAAEIHIVHWNLKYGSLMEAATRPDGLAVIGVLLNVRKIVNIA